MSWCGGGGNGMSMRVFSDGMRKIAATNRVDSSFPNQKSVKK